MTDASISGKRRALWTASAFGLACLLSIGTIWVARQAVGVDPEQLAEAAVQMALSQRPPSSGASEEQVRAQMLPFMRVVWPCQIQPASPSGNGASPEQVKIAVP